MRTIKTLILFILVSLSLSSCSNYDIDGELPLKHVSPYFFKSEDTFKVLMKTGNLSEIIEFNNTYDPLPNTEFSKFYLKKHPKQFSDSFNVTVNLNADNTITIEGVEHLDSELVIALKEYIEFASEGKSGLIHLNFDETLPLKHYIKFLTLIKPIESDNIKINKKIFIYNKAALPDCDCTL